ncbi:unnamed protein product, partial [Amoebophrya sp. A25]|eukprot:GSA25T00023241001.1
MKETVSLSSASPTKQVVDPWQSSRPKLSRRKDKALQELQRTFRRKIQELERKDGSGGGGGNVDSKAEDEDSSSKNAEQESSAFSNFLGFFGVSTTTEHAEQASPSKIVEKTSVVDPRRLHSAKKLHKKFDRKVKHEAPRDFIASKNNTSNNSKSNNSSSSSSASRSSS